MLFMSANIGEIIREIRKVRKMTQEQLAKNICSRREIIRIERGQHEPSPHLITSLSQKLNFDLQSCYLKLTFGTSLESYTLKLSLYSAIENQDISSIIDLISKVEALDEFKEGENLQLLYYAKALYYSSFKNNFDASNTYCLLGIQVDNARFSLETMDLRNLSHESYVLLNILGYNYMHLEKYNIACKIYEELLNILRTYPILSYNPYYKYSDSDRSLFQIICLNLSTVKYKIQNFEEALNFITEGIDFALKQHSLKLLPQMLIKKFCILCNLTRFEEAKIIYTECYYLLKLTSEENLLWELKDNYKKFFIDSKN
jgi:transcriptional regulator with XRE-family HTH domain